MDAVVLEAKIHIQSKKTVYKRIIVNFRLSVNSYALFLCTIPLQDIGLLKLTPQIPILSLPHPTPAHVLSQVVRSPSPSSRRVSYITFIKKLYTCKESFAPSASGPATNVTSLKKPRHLDNFASCVGYFDSLTDTRILGTDLIHKRYPEHSSLHSSIL